MNKPTAEQILTASRGELERIHKRLIAMRNRQYRESGNYADELAVAVTRIDFLLHDLMSGLITPFEAKPAIVAKKEPVRIQ